ncbi:class I SAM-dependent methyltransferase [Bacillus sp. FJAT-42315]|uniref:class I SAM-dependent methyltransferase n=1 Tax=Bacillus sp. FJAT-42315 TaxID=2014077 RepID=UPI000C244317|nr:methyltransferase [Bacillus sp. FJAT-42315]
MNEQEFDRFLGIDTIGLQEFPLQLVHYNRYEATPYAALDELFRSYELNSTDGVVDFGCGKGRLPFYVHHHFQLSVTGIEVNKQLYEEALHNKVSYMKKSGSKKSTLRFVCGPAEKYRVEPIDNRFYFFNPFSIQIFMKVVKNILISVEQNKRSVDIILYYPTIEYIHFLEEKAPFELLKEVKVPGMYEKDENERFLVFRCEEYKKKSVSL